MEISCHFEVIPKNHGKAVEFDTQTHLLFLLLFFNLSYLTASNTVFSQIEAPLQQKLPIFLSLNNVRVPNVFERCGPYLQVGQWGLNMGKLKCFQILIFQLQRAQVVSHVDNIWIRSWANFPQYMDSAFGENLEALPTPVLGHLKQQFCFASKNLQNPMRARKKRNDT